METHMPVTKKKPTLSVVPPVPLPQTVRAYTPVCRTILLSDLPEEVRSFVKERKERESRKELRTYTYVTALSDAFGQRGDGVTFIERPCFGFLSRYQNWSGFFVFSKYCDFPEYERWIDFVFSEDGFLSKELLEEWTIVREKDGGRILGVITPSDTNTREGRPYTYQTLMFTLYCIRMGWEHQDFVKWWANLDQEPALQVLTPYQIAGLCSEFIGQAKPQFSKTEAKSAVISVAILKAHHIKQAQTSFASRLYAVPFVKLDTTAKDKTPVKLAKKFESVVYNGAGFLVSSGSDTSEPPDKFQKWRVSTYVAKNFQQAEEKPPTLTEGYFISVIDNPFYLNFLKKRNERVFLTYQNVVDYLAKTSEELIRLGREVN
jgi:hypothetical protein